MDLIDKQKCPDRDYKSILYFQDHLTTFLILRLLHTKTAGPEFANCIVEELKVVWPELFIVHGKLRHIQSQGSIESVNQDVQKILIVWMDDVKINHGSEGLHFCQL